MPVTVYVKGLDELARSLTQFPKELQAKALAGAVSAAAKVSQDAIRAAAPVGGSDDRGHRIQKGGKGRFAGKGRTPGFLKRAVTRVIKHDGNQHGLTYQVGFLKAAYYWWFVERGFQHVAGRRVRGPWKNRHYSASKHVPARPFATSAFERSQSAAADAFANALAKQTDRIVDAVKSK